MKIRSLTPSTSALTIRHWQFWTNTASVPARNARRASATVSCYFRANKKQSAPSDQRSALRFPPAPHGCRLNLIIDAAPAKVNSFPQGIFALIFENPPSESLDTAFSMLTTKD
nr:MAG TPA: hypothetical protein [Caudoviricetes sp.]